MTEVEIHQLTTENARLRAGLNAAARSLETLARDAGDEAVMLGDIRSIRGYADTRAAIARNVLNNV